MKPVLDVTIQKFAMKATYLHWILLNLQTKHGRPSKSSFQISFQWPVFSIIEHITQSLLKLYELSWDLARKDWSPLKVSTHINS